MGSAASDGSSTESYGSVDSDEWLIQSVQHASGLITLASTQDLSFTQLLAGVAHDDTFANQVLCVLLIVGACQGMP